MTMKSVPNPSHGKRASITENNKSQEAEESHDHLTHEWTKHITEFSTKSKP